MRIDDENWGKYHICVLLHLTLNDYKSKVLPARKTLVLLSECGCSSLTASMFLYMIWSCPIKQRNRLT